MPLKIYSSHGKGLPDTMKLPVETDLKLNPHVLGSPWKVVYPQTVNSFTITAGSSPPAIIFKLPMDQAMDPSSFAFEFNATLTGNTVATETYDIVMVDYISSAITKIGIYMQGGVSGVVEEILNYGHLQYMLKSFYSTQYVNSVIAMLEGASNNYTVTVDAVSTTWGVVFNAKRRYTTQPNGRKYTIPLELGFFTTVRKIIPLFALPELRLEIYFSNRPSDWCYSAVAADLAKPTAAAFPATTQLEIDSPILIYKEITLSPAYVEAVNSKIAKYGKVRLDFFSWVNLSYALPSASAAGEKRLRIGTGIGMVNKLIFALGRSNPVWKAATGNTTATAFFCSPTIGSYVPANLSQYQIMAGGLSFPPRPLLTTWGTPEAATYLPAIGTSRNTTSMFETFYAQGVLDRDEHFMPYKEVSSVSRQFSNGNYTTAITNAIYCHEFGFGNNSIVPIAGINEPMDMDLILTFSAAPGDPANINTMNYADNLWSFYQTLKTIEIMPGRQCEVVWNQSGPAEASSSGPVEAEVGQMQGGRRRR